LRPSSPSDDTKLPSLQSVRFWLDNSGNNDCNFNDHNDSDKADDGGKKNNDVFNNSSFCVNLLPVGTDDDVPNDSSSSVLLLLEEMVIPGMQLNPYDALPAANCRKAMGQTVLDSEVIGINPDHERWIR
jgi:hypothetical protein